MRLVSVGWIDDSDVEPLKKKGLINENTKWVKNLNIEGPGYVFLTLSINKNALERVGYNLSVAEFWWNNYKGWDVCTSIREVMKVGFLFN